MIKITHISYSFGKGGASKAASNIINCLARKNFDIKKYSIINLWKNSKINFMKFLLINLFFRLIIRKKKNSFKLFDLYHKDTNIKNSDILHLHWIGNEFFSLKQIIRNNKKRPYSKPNETKKSFLPKIGSIIVRIPPITDSAANCPFVGII